MHKAWGLFDKYHWVWGDYFAGKENVAFPIKYQFISLQVLVLCFTTVMFWLLRRVCIYYPRPWNLSQFSVKNVFRQWEIFLEVAAHTDACAYIDSNLLIYLYVISKVNIYVESHGYYSPSNKTLSQNNWRLSAKEAHGDLRWTTIISFQRAVCLLVEPKKNLTWHQESLSRASQKKNLCKQRISFKFPFQIFNVFRSHWCTFTAVLNKIIKPT